MVDSSISNVLVVDDGATRARGSEQDPETANKKASTTDSTTTAEASDATASSTASTTSEERSAVDVERYLPFQSTQQQILVLSQLAKQLEYYFSQQNLANDPYLQTLRDLNDGCAPVSILANFTKVKLLLPVADDDVRIHAILQAATQYSELLRVLSIDTSTGHVATDLTPSSAKTILAVGPVGQEPLSLSSSSSVTTASASASTSTGANGASSSPPLPSTVILRDVLPDVTEEQVRELFEQLQECPTVTSIHMDVGHCWYVPLSLSYPTFSRKISFKCHHHRIQKHVLTLALSLFLSLRLSLYTTMHSHTHRFVKLDTTSREDMLRVMMQLRSSTLADYPVHARLKSSVTAPVDGGGKIWLPNKPWASPVGSLAAVGKKKKTRTRGKRKKKTVSSQGATEVRVLEKVAEISAVLVQVQQPSLSEDDFPTLLDNHVEWETPLEEQEDVNNKEEESESKSSSKNLSDMASTATTASSSSSSIDKQRTTATLGYAAALRKAIANPTAVAAPSVSKEISIPPTDQRNEESSTLPVTPDVIPVVNPAKWVSGRSFVDILRTSS